MFNKLPLQFSMAFGIVAMGVVGIVLAWYVGDSYSHFTVESQRDAYEDIIHLRINDRLEELRKLSRDLGQAVQNNAGFHQSLREKDVQRVESYLESQFHQYFVTAGIIKLNALIVLDPAFHVVGQVTDQKDQMQGIGGSSCESLLDRASKRKGPERLKMISEICVHDGYPLMHVIIPIGGFRIAGYLEIVSHPTHNLAAIEKDLGLPIKIELPNKVIAYQSKNWPKQEEHDKHITASHMHHGETGEAVFHMHIMRDIKEFHQRLSNTRFVSMFTAGLITLAVALLTLYFVKTTTLNPIQSLARHLRGIQADRSSLGQTVEVSGNHELQLLAQSYNNMTCKLKALYDELEHTNAELKGEVAERQRAEIQLKLHRDHLEELVEKRTADLAIARDAAVHANKAKSQFLANMSHELRTPLNAVIGYSDMLLENQAVMADEAAVDDVNKILSSGKHLLALINDILDISKIEAGKIGLELYDFGIAELIEDVVRVTKPLLDKNKNRLVMDFSNTIGFMHADPTKLSQVLINLLSNAAKFTSNGTITLSVQRQPYGDGENIKFIVRDTGIGLSQPELRKIFQVFTQADESTTRKYGGTGLGLAISRYYCEMMGGELTATGEPDIGAEFTVIIPAQVHELASLQTQVGPGQAVADEPKDRRMVSEHDQERRRYMSKILIVGEDPEVSVLIKKLLQEKGYEALLPQNDQSAIDAVYELKPDVVVLDMLLKGVDGWSILTSIKQDPALQDIPVIAMSMMEDKDMGFALGAIDYLPKPIDTKRLLSLVNQNVRKASKAPILLIEKNPEIRQSIKNALEKSTWRIIDAEGATEALALLEKQEPCLIIHNLIMEEMDGFEFLSKLRADPRWRSIPHITISAEDLSDLDHQRLQQSVNGVLQQTPTNRQQTIDEVIAAVNYCVAGS